MNGRLLIYDAFSVNPYTRELARILAADSIGVTVLQPRHLDQWPDRVTFHGRLGRSSMEDGFWRHVFDRALVPATIWRTSRAHDQIIVVWARDVLDRMALLALLLLTRKRIHIIDHNPTRRPRKWLTNRLDELTARLSATTVVHRAELASHAMSGKRLAVVPHPSYDEWRRRYYEQLSDSKRKPGTFLIIGSLREDKGRRVIADIIAGLRENEKLVVAGAVSDAKLPGLAEGKVQLLRTDGLPVTDAQLAQSMATCWSILAPYTNVTQSGSVILALTCAVPVVAYEDPAMAELLEPAQLVPPYAGDLLDRARRLGGRSRPRTLAEQDAQTLFGWKSLLAGKPALAAEI